MFSFEVPDDKKARKSWQEDGRKALGAALAIGIPAAIGYGLGWAADHEYLNVIVVPDGRGSDQSRDR